MSRRDAKVRDSVNGVTLHTGTVDKTLMFEGAQMTSDDGKPDMLCFVTAIKASRCR